MPQILIDMQKIINYSDLKERIELLSTRYVNAEPYPHIVLDNIIDPKMLQVGLDEFPTPDDSRWFICPNINGELRNKQAIWDFEKMPDTLSRIMLELNAGPFVQFLEKLTGIYPLVSDPHLYGAGLHMTRQGGSLGIHADHNINPRVLLYRRVSVILYLNEAWEDSWGGQLEMWSNNMTHCVEKITPLFGRMVIFSNSETSYHGHPTPLTCPEGIDRKSLAIYFDSINPDPSYTPKQHRALFQNPIKK